MPNEELKQEVKLREKSNKLLDELEVRLGDISKEQKKHNQNSAQYIKLQQEKKTLQKQLNRLVREEEGFAEKTLDIGKKLLQNVIATGKYREIERRSTSNLAIEFEGLKDTAGMLTAISGEWDEVLEGSKLVSMEHRGILESMNQLVSDMGDQILQNVENESLLGQQGFGASKVEQLEKQAMYIENLLANQKYSSNIESEHIDKLKDSLGLIKDRITQEKFRSVELELQNEKVKEGTDLLMSGVIKVKDMVDRMPGGKFVRTVLGFDDETINKATLAATRGLSKVFTEGGKVSDVLSEVSKVFTGKGGLSIATLGALLISFAGLAKIISFIKNAAFEFAENIDEVGAEFGVMSKDTLPGLELQVIGIGFELKDILSVMTGLTSEFGLSVDEAEQMAAKVLDTSKALGLSSDEGTKLFGIFGSILGLSAKQSETLAENTYQLAEQSGAAPQAVMKDIAVSSETIAKFSQAGGENIGIAAIQAQRLGVTLQTVGGIMESLLDFQSSIQKEIEASVLLGKDLNFQRARELALNNDMAGAMREVVGQLGSEEELLNMNFYQRKAIADVLGTSVGDITKLINNQENLNALADDLTGKSFADLVGDDAMSNLTNFLNQVKLLGVAIVQSIGPALESMAEKFKNIAQWLTENQDRLKTFASTMMTAISFATTLLTITASLAIANIWKTAFGGVSMGPTGLLLGLIGASVATAMFRSAMSELPDLPDHQNLKRGNVAMATAGEPAGTFGVGESVVNTTDLQNIVDTKPLADEISKLELKMDAQLESQNRMITTIVDLFSFGGGASKAMGSEYRKAIDRTGVIG